MNENLTTIVKYHWESVVLALSEGSPIVARILRDARPELRDGRLELHFPYDNSFIFEHKSIDKRISAYFQDGWSVPVSFVSNNEQRSQINTHRSTPKQPAEPPSRGAVSLVPQTIEPPPWDTKESPKELQKELQNKLPNEAPKKQYTASAQPSENKFTRRGKNAFASSHIEGERIRLDSTLPIEKEIVVEGRIFELEHRETRSGTILTILHVYDGNGSITAKSFHNPKKAASIADFKKGDFVAIRGTLRNDDYTHEITLMAEEIAPATPPQPRQDNATHKRIELHLHTQMSSMDGITHISDYIRQAAQWGHEAIAITDHGVVQAFPDAAAAAKKHGIKPIYGMEAYVVDDLCAIVSLERGQSLSTDFVVFDIETTGLTAGIDTITEIGALRITDGIIGERFSTLINPRRSIPAEITKLTGITDEMVANAPFIEEALPKFLEFAGDCVLVAHNASFDIGFIAAEAGSLGLVFANTFLDTLELSRLLFPQLKRHRLDTVAAHLGVSLDNHHRAVDDAAATAHIFQKMQSLLGERENIESLKDLNELSYKIGDKRRLRAFHATLLVQNLNGLRNLYELVSLSHMKYFYKKPIIPKSELMRLRDGLLVGSACASGEVFLAVAKHLPQDILTQITSFYDFLEIHPLSSHNATTSKHRTAIKHANKRILHLGTILNKTVVAVSNAHFLNPEDEAFRKIVLSAGDEAKHANTPSPRYFRTTTEMLREFAYLDMPAVSRHADKKLLRLRNWQSFLVVQKRLRDKNSSSNAYEVVVYNPKKINALIEDGILPIPNGSFPPSIDGAVEELQKLTWQRTAQIYGANPHKIVQDRLERELSSIIDNGFAVMYVASARLVSQSVADGYLVGSRGSVGSSIVATMAGITEVNPLPPHYICPNCKLADFDSQVVKSFAGGSGCDMPSLNCQSCGTEMDKDGHDIPFETFLGIDGDKEPDIDLNFSGEYQSKAHAQAEALFGEGNVVRAGTISTMAEKTAYGYVRKYMEEHQLSARSAEINRLRAGCTGIKRTTGQHPGGLMILPKGRSIYEFCPVQHPANDSSAEVITTHFDYHALSGCLMKLDILGHDVPSILKILQNLTGLDPLTIDLADPSVISLFTSPRALGLDPADIGCNTGSLGLPEFGTAFVRGMLEDTKPTSFAELVRISGLSHGTDVWLGNAQELIRQGIASLKEVIPTRDDIMVYLVHHGVERLAAFKIMENVRKGKGLTSLEEEQMRSAGVPEWYIESCQKIKYMFPKGHAVAYVMMSVRIGYYKVYHPHAFYAATFSMKTADFDYALACGGPEAVRRELARLETLGRGEATAKERSLQTLLELVNEMYARGISFAPLDIYTSDASKFGIINEKILPPLASVAGLGGNVATNIVEEREKGEFLSIEDFRKRTKANRNVIEFLEANKLLGTLSKTNQVTLM